MELKAAMRLVDRIRLVGGVVVAYGDTGEPDRIRIVVGIWIKERGGRRDAKMTKIQTAAVVMIAPMQSDAELLFRVQGLWSSLWLHESLENFILVDQEGKASLPFNPHCRDSIRPMTASYLDDGTCERVDVVDPKAETDRLAGSWNLGTTNDPRPNGKGMTRE